MRLKFHFSFMSLCDVQQIEVIITGFDTQIHEQI
jgi:hypothetical protein